MMVITGVQIDLMDRNGENNKLQSKQLPHSDINKSSPNTNELGMTGNTKSSVSLWFEYLMNNDLQR